MSSCANLAMEETYSMNDALKLPLPKIDPLNKPFWEFARAGKLAVQKCNACGDRHFPPGPVCPECLAISQSWEVVSGKGKIFSWAEFHHAYWDEVRAGLPYNVCMVQLDEGPILISNLVGVPLQEARLGMPVTVVFEEITDDICLPKFTRV